MIVVLKKGKGYLVASDLYLDVTSQTLEPFLETDHDVFVDNCNENTLIAIPRNSKYREILRYFSEFKLPKGNRKLTMEYVNNTFLPIFLEELKKFNFLPRNKFAYLDEEIILIKKDVGYLIGEDTGVMQIGNEEIIGTGAEYSFPILRTNDYIKDPFDRILDVFRKCKKRLVKMGDKIVMYDSTTLEGKIYDI